MTKLGGLLINVIDGKKKNPERKGRVKKVGTKCERKRDTGGGKRICFCCASGNPKFEYSSNKGGKKIQFNYLLEPIKKRTSEHIN